MYWSCQKNLYLMLEWMFSLAQISLGCVWEKFLSPVVLAVPNFICHNMVSYVLRVSEFSLCFQYPVLRTRSHWSFLTLLRDPPISGKVLRFNPGLVLWFLVRTFCPMLKSASVVLFVCFSLDFFAQFGFLRWKKKVWSVWDMQLATTSTYETLKLRYIKPAGCHQSEHFASNVAFSLVI